MLFLVCRLSFVQLVECDKFFYVDKRYMYHVEQGCPTACGPRSLLVHPARKFLIRYSIILNNHSAFEPIQWWENSSK